MVRFGRVNYGRKWDNIMDRIINILSYAPLIIFLLSLLFCGYRLYLLVDENRTYHYVSDSTRNAFIYSLLVVFACALFYVLFPNVRNVTVSATVTYSN